MLHCYAVGGGLGRFASSVAATRMSPPRCQFPAYGPYSPTRKRGFKTSELYQKLARSACLLAPSFILPLSDRMKLDRPFFPISRAQNKARQSSTTFKVVKFDHFETECSVLRLLRRQECRRPVASSRPMAPTRPPESGVSRQVNYVKSWRGVPHANFSARTSPDTGHKSRKSYAEDFRNAGSLRSDVEPVVRHRRPQRIHRKIVFLDVGLNADLLAFRQVSAALQHG